ncbi:MAG: condensation domain-containing protein, partial [Acidobacteriota bacterium]
REDRDNGKQLVAYLVAKQDEVIAVNELRAYLKAKLPEYMLPSTYVVLDRLPLNPNGKIDRRALPVPEQNRKGLVTAYTAPSNNIEQTLANIWTQVLGINQVGVHDNFFELGGDSILSIQIISKANQAGVHLTARQMFQHQTIAELAAVAQINPGILAEQGLVSGSVPLTPIQYWFFEQNLADVHHWNQAILLTVKSKIDGNRLGQAVERLLLHHDALRLRFVYEQSSWQQLQVEADVETPVTVIDLSMAAEPSLLIEQVAKQVQASLNLSQGPLMRVVLFDLGTNRPSRLLVVIHHLAVDVVSWRILFEDLQSLYEQLATVEVVKLPAKTTSFQQWSLQLNKYAQSQELEQELDYWLKLPWHKTHTLPVDFADINNIEDSAQTLTLSLSVEETRLLLQEMPSVYHTQINDLLLAALAQTFYHFSGKRNLLLALESHGREGLFAEVDLTRTVGWFTSSFPVLLVWEKSDNPGELLRSIKEQLRAIPNRGLGYGLLRYLNGSPAAKKLSQLPEPEISFNYLGQLGQTQSVDSLFEPAKESAEPSRSLQNSRRYLLSINSMIANGELQISWIYSENIHKRATVTELAERYLLELRLLIAHCQTLSAGGYTPSDFPLAKLNQQQLDQLVGNDPYIEDIYPLTPMQQGLLFHTLYAPQAGFYFEQISCEIEGVLNSALFQQAWQEVLKRHEALRASFFWEGLSAPVQIVRKQVIMACQEQDWRSLSYAEQQERLETYLKQDRELGFELSQAPLMRMSIIQMDGNSYQLIWSHHHLIMDGWCSSILFKEVLSYYRGYCEGQMVELGYSRRYRDYIEWLYRQDLEKAERYWRERLQGFSAPTALMVDRKQAIAEQDYREEYLRLSVTATSTLQTIAMEYQLTINNLVQGVWAILLSRYSGEMEVVYGVTVSGRPAELVGAERMVGMFINTLPLRVPIRPEKRVSEWLVEVQQRMAEMMEYEYSPLFQVQQWSEVPTGKPLFESILVFENYPVESGLAEASSMVQVKKVHTIEKTNYPLTVAAVPGEQLLIRITYDCGRFVEETIKRMVGHVENLLARIISNPQERVSSLSLLSEVERNQLLMEWNSTTVEYPYDKCVHQLFEEQVTRTPSAIAVVYEQEQLSYQELNCRANQLAHYLISLGVGPEVLVGICLERSIEMIIAIMGVLKAGGAYLPIDPGYPLERIAFMLENACVPLILTEKQRVDELSKNLVQIVCLDSEWVTISSH